MENSERVTNAKTSALAPGTILETLDSALDSKKPTRKLQFLQHWPFLKTVDSCCTNSISETCNKSGV